MPRVLRVREITEVELDRSYDSLDGGTLQAAAAILLDLAQMVEPPHVIFDMSATVFIGSEFLEVLFRVWRRLSGRQGQFAVCNVNPHCHEVLKITGLEKLWPAYATREEALAALAPSCA